MDDFYKRIESIRSVMKKMKMEKYAISIPDLISLDEYHKSLYLKVLATVIQYENDITEMQSVYYGRIVCGAKSEHSQQDYMRMALEISEDDICEFIPFMNGSVAKYYFALDGIILISLSETSQNGYDYLAELIELIGVDKSELDHISLVAKSVLCQESSYYDEAKNNLTETIKRVDYIPYIQNYYTGAIVENKYCIHYSSPVRDNENFITLQKEYRQEKVIFENVNFKIESDMGDFIGCDEVVFNNCNITGQRAMVFKSCKKVVFKNTSIHDFTCRIFFIDSVPEFIIDGCEIYDNQNSREERNNKTDILALIFVCNNSNVVFMNSTVKNCTVKNETGYSLGSLICNRICYIINSKFINCKGYCGDSYESGYLFSGIIGKDYNGKNEFIGISNIVNSVYTIEDYKKSYNESYQIVSKYIKE